MEGGRGGRKGNIFLINIGVMKRRPSLRGNTARGASFHCPCFVLRGRGFIFALLFFFFLIPSGGQMGALIEHF